MSLELSSVEETKNNDMVRSVHTKTLAPTGCEILWCQMHISWTQSKDIGGFPVSVCIIRVTLSATIIMNLIVTLNATVNNNDRGNTGRKAFGPGLISKLRLIVKRKTQIWNSSPISVS